VANTQKQNLKIKLKMHR